MPTEIDAVSRSLDGNMQTATPTANVSAPVLTPTITPDAAPTSKHPLLLSFTPGGSEQWIRRVEEEFTPQLGMIFQDLQSAISFYSIYSLACGFKHRLYTNSYSRGGILSKKVIVCNRQGFRSSRRKVKLGNEEAGEAFSSENIDPGTIVDNVEHGGIVDNEVKVKKTRRNKITRFGCKARMRVEAMPDGRFRVDEFIESHNHQLFSVKDREYQQIARNLTLYHKKTIIDHSKLQIGPSRSFHICKEYADGYSNIGATVTDFKNFNRDIKCFIGLNDAQMFITRLEELCKSSPGFYLSYELDDEQCLNRIFWADHEARQNYRMFGDCLSYDATYGTNKYFMIFTPFTGVDHHKRSVCFGAALLANEDEHSYEWCLQKFMDCMGHKAPNVIVTDQDPALKKVIPVVFEKARHRLCMWHIMQKMADKVGSKICKETDFLSQINAVVWDNELEPEVFEDRWLQIINDFELEGNTWLSSMYRDRGRWIPAFFRDLEMGGILRTTQRSESENSYFKRFENHFGTLVEFWMRFESAIEQQRYSQKRLDHECLHSLPVTVTMSKMEMQAASVYTHKVFYDVQGEIKASLCHCGLGGLTVDAENHLYSIEDELRRKAFQVKFDVATNVATCACKMFESKGLLCRHIFYVLGTKLIKSIPTQYILSRWTRKEYRTPAARDGNLVHDYDARDVVKLEISNVWSEFYATIGVVRDMSEQHIKELASVLKSFREKVCPPSEPLTKEKEIEKLLGCSASSEIRVMPPRKSKNKGSGKRLVSDRKVAISKAEKPKRLCANCKQMANHDRRNCPLKSVEVSEEGDEGNSDDDFD